MIRRAVFLALAAAVLVAASLITAQVATGRWS